MPRNPLTALATDDATFLAACTAAPTMLLMPLIKPRIRSAPADTSKPLRSPNAPVILPGRPENHWTTVSMPPATAVVTVSIMFANQLMTPVAISATLPTIAAAKPANSAMISAVNAASRAKMLISGISATTTPTAAAATWASAGISGMTACTICNSGGMSWITTGSNWMKASAMTGSRVAIP